MSGLVFDLHHAMDRAEVPEVRGEASTTVLERLGMLIAERDRLWARCRELEQRLAEIRRVAR